MNEPNQLNVILDRIAAGTWTKDDPEALRHVTSAADGPQNTVQVGRYNIDIGQGQDIQLGDRVYQGASAEAIQRAVLEAPETHPSQPRAYRVRHNLPQRYYGAFVGRALPDADSWLLTNLAPALIGLPPAALRSLWEGNLPILAARGRKELLSGLQVLTPVLVAMGGEEAVVEPFAIQDVGRWWP